MKTAAVFSALVVLCWLAPAQTAPAPKRKEYQLSANFKIYEPKNLTPGRANRVANFVQSVIPGVKLYWDDVPNAVVIRGPNAEEVDAAETLFKKFDVPQEPEAPSHQIDCTVYLVRASQPAPTDPRNGMVRVPSSPPTSPVPAELQPAIDEMKSTFGYEHYALWDALPIQPRSDGGEMQGILPVSSDARPYLYTLSYAGYNHYPDAKSLTLNNFLFSIKIPYGSEGIESHIKTGVTVHENQKLVLGKIRLAPSEHADLFLVIATKVR